MNKSKFSWIALTGLSISNLLGCLDLTIVNTALPFIQTSLSLSKTQLQWIMNILLLSLTAFMVVIGKLADKYGRRLVLYIGMFLFALASLGAGLTLNFHILIFFRFLQGISIAILYTAPVALIPVVFPEKTGKAMGILFGVSGFGLAIGPAIGGILTSVFSWRAIFFINPPIVLLAFLLCLKSLPESTSGTNEKIDFIGAILLIILLPLLIFTVVNIHTIGLFTVQATILYLLIVLLTILFVVREKKIAFPIVNFQLLTNSRFIIGIIANFFLAFFYAVDLFFIPLHLHHLDNFSSEKIGLILLSPTIMVALLSPLSGSLCDRFGTGIILSIGYLFFVISAFLQIRFSSGLHPYLLLVPFVLFGAGWAFILSPSLLTAILALPVEMGGIAMGTIGTLHNLGGTLGLTIASPMNYSYAMQLIMITSLLSLVIILLGLKNLKKY